MEKKKIKTNKKKPEIVLRASSGGVSATVFKQTVVGKYGTTAMFNVSLQKSYKDKDDEWQYGSNFAENDLIKLYAVLDKVRAEIFLRKEKDEDSEDTETEDIEEDQEELE